MLFHVCFLSFEGFSTNVVQKYHFNCFIPNFFGIYPKISTFAAG